MFVRRMFPANDEALPVIDMSRMKDLRKKYLLLGGAKWLRQAIDLAELPHQENRLLRSLTQEERNAIVRDLWSGHCVKKVALNYNIKINTAQYLKYVSKN